MADDVWTKDNVLSGLATKEQIDTLIQTNREVKSLLSDFMSFYRRDNWVEKISLRNEPQMLPLNGYRHIGIWVSEIDLPMTVNIGLPGIQSTSVELVAGLNALPDIDGMFISGSVGQIANVVRSNDPLTVSAATVLGQQGTLTNPVIIEQTGSLAPVATASGTLASGPITIAAGANYSPPSLDTNGYHYALFVPQSVSGSGTLAIGSNIQSVQGVEIGVHNAGSTLPPGFTGENGAIGFSPPINDQVKPAWLNSSSTASITLGDILYVLSA